MRYDFFLVLRQMAGIARRFGKCACPLSRLPFADSFALPLRRQRLFAFLSFFLGLSYSRRAHGRRFCNWRIAYFLSVPSPFGEEASVGSFGESPRGFLLANLAGLYAAFPIAQIGFWSVCKKKVNKIMGSHHHLKGHVSIHVIF
jgi:hypothetical protein